MKLVKEYIILEKFIEDSDPIHDMGIGIFHKRTFENMVQVYDFLYVIIPGLFNVNHPTDILAKRYKQLGFTKNYGIQLKQYFNEYITIQSNTPHNIWAWSFLDILDFSEYIIHRAKRENIKESFDARKKAEQKTTFITDNKNLGLKKRIITIFNDSDKKRVKICLVNGSYVKSTDPGLGFKEFVEGGHHYVDSYPGYKKYIPEDEIWIDDVFKQKPEELKAIIQHEFIERNLMKYKGWNYSKAHEYANKKEENFRKK